jgi:putative oxidoreductase
MQRSSAHEWIKQVRVDMYAFFNTDDSWSSLILRVTLGVVMFAHGAQKLLGWYGGNGFNGTMAFLTDVMHLPWLVAFLIIIGESLGSLALIAGFLTRLMGASFIVIMLGAIAMVHWPQGFFMNWLGKQAGEGFEYHLLVMAMSTALLLNGGGRWSLDGLIACRLDRRESQPRVYRKEFITAG